MNNQLFKCIGGLFRKKDSSGVFFERMLGFRPLDIQLYKLACIHRSSAIKDSKGHVVNNERLEFLGDSVLSTVIADVLYKRFPYKDEGELTNLRSKLVKRETLDNLAYKIGLDKVVVSVQKLDQRHGPKIHIGGNAFEALMGAIYLDRGYETCTKFIKRLIDEKKLDMEQASREESNYKSKLIEWAQHNKCSYEFRLVDSQINKKDNTTTFKTEVVIDGKIMGTGMGLNKKQSQQNAAKAACEAIDRQ